LFKLEMSLSDKTRTRGPAKKRIKNQRAINKSEKLRRIKASARALFLKNGYDETTMREIADRAGVGVGTLFSYAADKRDLLFLIYNDELQRVTQTGFTRGTHNSSFLSNVVAAFSGYYAFFAREPEFMRHVLREIMYYSSGPEAPRIMRGREMIMAGLNSLIAEARGRDQIDSTSNNMAIAKVIFSIYQAEVRQWLAEVNPVPSEGLRSLRKALQILIVGLSARE
jgi:AcrR family transcriptional regulator